MGEYHPPACIQNKLESRMESFMNYMGDSAWWRERFKGRKLEIMGHERCLEEDMSYFPLKGKILDVACGDGRNSIYLAFRL
jgi:2-polyprenyl-3-methyl-5-hydroxy-6-metoxy-1,4-benzoquinol methylase